MAANPVPLPQPTHRKVRDAAVLAGAFLAGAAIGFAVVAHAVGRDVFDRFQSVTRR
jgi:hypothetical protein